MGSVRITKAAGGIVWRRRSGPTRTEARVDVLIVHRPAYDDWTFPKGKVDPGEELQTAAVREIAEEAGITVRLGHPLPEQSYPISSGVKTVAYWSARVASTSESTFTPNKEIDEVRWVSLRDARKLLTYEHDVALLETFAGLVDQKAHRTRTLIVLRHGKAVARDEFDGDDLDRPLSTVGLKRADSLTALLNAYAVRHIVSSPAVRCTQTVEPYTRSTNILLQLDDRLEEATRSSAVQRSLDAMLGQKQPVVLCTHRPTLPWVFDAIGTRTYDLAPGQAVAIHHRKGVVLASELLA